MSGTGPFLWLMKHAPPAGFQQLPPGGMCVCAYLFVTRGGQILLGKYADDPRWEALAGLDPDRRRTHGSGWTVPASHLKLGEDPRDDARRVGDEALGISGSRYSEPRSEIDFYPSKMVPGEMHYDIWFFIDGTPPKDTSSGCRHGIRSCRGRIPELCRRANIRGVMRMSSRGGWRRNPTTDAMRAFPPRVRI